MSLAQDTGSHAEPDDEISTLDQITNNAEYWDTEHIEINFPACGLNFGSILLLGASGDYWTATDGGLDQTNPGRDDYAISLSLTDNYTWVGDSGKTNLQNIRMVAAE